MVKARKAKKSRAMKPRKSSRKMKDGWRRPSNKSKASKVRKLKRLARS